MCDGTYHVEYSGLPDKVVNAFLSIVQHTGWTCSSCRTAARQTMQKLQASLSELIESAAQLKVDMNNLSHNQTKGTRNNAVVTQDAAGDQHPIARGHATVSTREEDSSYEIADAVAHILNASFSCGVVPCQWRQAVVTPIPKVPKPQSLSDYRPIFVTPLLSRVASGKACGLQMVTTLNSCHCCTRPVCFQTHG